jgi:cell division protein FtsW
VRKVYLLSSVVLFAPLLATGAWLRWETIQTRVLAFLNPDEVYQVRHSLLALGSGGLFGKGLGAGHQKLKFLPEPYTDFILSIIGEELGLVGCLTVLTLFVVLLWASVGIASRARDYFGFVVASGIAMSLALQAATNIAVVTASAPTKGIPLPFLTFGGSGLCMTLAQVGILLSVERVRRVEGPVQANVERAGHVVRGRPRSRRMSVDVRALQEGV